MSRHFKAYVIENVVLGKNIFKLKIGSDSISKIAKPGQFVNIKCTEGLEGYDCWGDYNYILVFLSGLFDLCLYRRGHQRTPQESQEA